MRLESFKYNPVTKKTSERKVIISQGEKSIQEMLKEIDLPFQIGDVYDLTKTSPNNYEPK